jgi:hypothetical protein
MRTTKRVLVAGLIAATLLMSPGGLLLTPTASAAPTGTTVGQTQGSCEAQGYLWSTKLKRCASRPCPGGGTPGASKTTAGRGGRYTTVWCDGLTGKWTRL